MDKKLELRLIEKGYDTTSASEVTLADAGKIIKEEVYNNSRDRPAGMILFDGMTHAIVRTGLGHSIMDKPALAVEGGDGIGGLYINAPQEDIDGQRSSVYIEKDGSYFVVVPKRESYMSANGLDLVVKCENDLRDSAKVELFKADDTKVLYLPATDIVQADRLFWQHVGNQFGLELTEIDPQYTDKSPLTPWYSAKDETTGTNLTLGTRFRVYAVRSEFSTEKSAEELWQIVDGLRVNPQTVNGSWNPEFSRSGKVCETHIDRGQGDQVVAYVANLLKTK